MKSFYKIISIIFISVFFINCSSDDQNNGQETCDTGNTNFQQLYTATLAGNSAYDDYTNMDLLTHEYTFTIGSSQTVCSIGYQGNANLHATGIPYYKIEIVDNSTGTIIHSGNYDFDDAQTEYFSITPVTLSAGTSYTIKRTVTNDLNDIGNTVGRILRFNGSAPYPLTYGDITITASDFYGDGGPVNDYGIPYIDMAFQ
jgi:hypothetical protein